MAKAKTKMKVKKTMYPAKQVRPKMKKRTAKK